MDKPLSSENNVVELGPFHHRPDRHGGRRARADVAVQKSYPPLHAGHHVLHGREVRDTAGRRRGRGRTCVGAECARGGNPERFTRRGGNPERSPRRGGKPERPPRRSGRFVRKTGPKPHKTATSRAELHETATSRRIRAVSASSSRAFQFPLHRAPWIWALTRAWTLSRAAGVSWGRTCAGAERARGGNPERSPRRGGRFVRKTGPKPHETATSRAELHETATSRKLEPHLSTEPGRPPGSRQDATPRRHRKEPPPAFGSP